MSIHDSRTSIGRAGLVSLMGDPRYTDADHPEHDMVVDMIRRGFEMVMGEADAPGPLRAALGGTGASLPGFTTLFQDAIAGGRRIDLMNSDARAAFGRGLLLRAIRAEGATMPTGFDREDVGAARFRNPLAARGADGDPAPREPQARRADPAKLAPATPAKPQAGEGTKPSEQVAMSRRLNPKAQQEIDEAKRDPGKEDIVFTMEESRQWAVLKDRRVRFNIDENPLAKSGEPGLASHNLGAKAVRKYNHLIEREATKQGVKPDLVRAIMYVENAQGSLYGIPAEILGVADSILPMNVKKSVWSKLDGKDNDLHNPEDNIRIGVMLIKRIQDRIKDHTPEKIASIYNFMGAEKITDFGARVGQVSKGQLWAKQTK